MKNKKSGSVLIETLLSLTLQFFTLCTLCLLSFKIWAKSFTNLESFYLLRARLYENTQNCFESKLVPQTLIRRSYDCRKDAFPLAHF
jgi:hypothetical protein